MVGLFFLKSLNFKFPKHRHYTTGFRHLIIARTWDNPVGLKGGDDDDDPRQLMCLHLISCTMWSSKVEEVSDPAQYLCLKMKENVTWFWYFDSITSHSFDSWLCRRQSKNSYWGVAEYPTEMETLEFCLTTVVIKIKCPIIIFLHGC